MCISIVYFPDCDVINFESNLIFLIKLFLCMTKKSRQFKYLNIFKKLNILRTKRAFQKKAFFIIFKGLSFAKNCLRPESAPLIRIVRAKLYPSERTVGSVQYKWKRCHTCHNVKETEIFTSATTGKTFKINHKLNSNDKCLVYLLKCNVCLKQYVGQTVEEFRYRWNNYKNNGRKN